MQLTIKKGWLHADTERVRLATVTAYRLYDETGIELTTPHGPRRFELSPEWEPIGAPVGDMGKNEPACKKYRQQLDDRAARHRAQSATTAAAALAELDAYFAKNP
jgi:hypothetical protein